MKTNKSIVTVFLLFVQLLTSSAFANSEIVDFYSCESRQLTIILNKDNEASKKEILAGIKALHGYGDLAVSLHYSYNSTELNYNVRSIACDTLKQDEQCAEPKSWQALQWRLKTIKAVEVQCAPPPSGAREEEEHGKEEDGGATGEN